ncbi:MAG: hypothetical protein K8T20_02820 [Planctomycetes bacterium]|nr:hypothetical protein [Planctomycetota bacterium]
MHPRRLSTVLLAGSWLAAGCGPQHAPMASREASAPSWVNVVESSDAHAGEGWVDRATDTADYEALLEKAAAFGHPVTQEALDAQIKSLDDGDVPLETATLPEADLRRRIVEATNIGFLLDGLDARRLEVVTTSQNTANGTVERDLVFVDPYAGKFKGILLMPEGPGPFPAVVAIHGHPDDAETYRDSFHGKDFPAHGYAVLMLTMRAMAIDAAEHQVSVDLLRGGFTLVGMRVYETLLGLKYLRFLAAKDSSIDAGRIGLIGHSGGSSASDLTVRLEPLFRAYVSDNSVDWHRSDSTWEKFIGKREPWHCETVPALFPINEQIRDFSTSATPIEKVAYGTAKSQSGNDGIIEFFDGVLKR